MSYFKQALEQIAKMHESKSQDYTRESEFENFEHSAKAAGVSVLQAIDILVSTKEARIISLRGREARNESIEDTYLDRAVYSIIAYARILYENGNQIQERRADYNKGLMSAPYDQPKRDAGPSKYMNNPGDENY